MDYRKFIDPLLDVRRTVAFSATSLAGLVLETIVLMLLVELVNTPILVAKIIGSEASITAMFLLNNKFTYSGRPGKVLTRFVKSNFVRTGGILISLVVLEIGVEIGVWYPLANIAGVCVGFVFNYGLETAYTWKEHRSS